MKYFLILIILGLSCGGYYEYTVFEQKADDDQRQIITLNGELVTLQSENKKLEDYKEWLIKNVRDDQAKIGELCGQIQANQNALAKTNKQAPKDPNAGKPAMAAQPPPTNNLGTITTQDGRTFQNCRVIKVKTDGIVVSYSEGITEIKYALLPPDLQKKFGFDPRQAAALTQAQLQYQEEQKNAAAQAAGN